MEDMTRPSTLSILKILVKAGETGMQSGDISRAFGEPAREDERIRYVNSILHRLKNGRMARFGPLEPSPRYRHRKARRWYVTPAGTEYLTAGGLTGVIMQRKQDRGSQQALRLTNASTARQQALQAAQTALDHGALTCRNQRAAAIPVLRRAGLTVQEVADVLGLSRERIRQIQARGPGKRPCNCQLCRNEEGNS